MSYSYASLEVSQATFNEIRDKLRDIGYGCQIIKNVHGEDRLLNMVGLALIADTNLNLAK